MLNCEDPNIGTEDIRPDLRRTEARAFNCEIPVLYNACKEVSILPI
jgi:hypothetical protein